SRIGRAVLFGDHSDRFAKFLVCYGTPRIDSQRPLELTRCARQVALIPQLDAALDVQFAGFKPCPVQLDLVAGIVRVRLGGFLVEVESGVVVLKCLRLLTLSEVGPALRATRCQESETNT